MEGTLAKSLMSCLRVKHEWTMQLGSNKHMTGDNGRGESNVTCSERGSLRCGVRNSHK